MQWGPSLGYFPEPEKSWLVCESKMEEYAHCTFDREELVAIQITHGMRYMGGRIGTEGTKAAWRRPKVQQWVEAVEVVE